MQCLLLVLLFSQSGVFSKIQVSPSDLKVLSRCTAPQSDFHHDSKHDNGLFFLQRCNSNDTKAKTSLIKSWKDVVHHVTSYLHPFTCLYTDNSPYLGTFYNLPKVSNDQKVKELLKSFDDYQWNNPNIGLRHTEQHWNRLSSKMDVISLPSIQNQGVFSLLKNMCEWSPVLFSIDYNVTCISRYDSLNQMWNISSLEHLIEYVVHSNGTGFKSQIHLIDKDDDQSTNDSVTTYVAPELYVNSREMTSIDLSTFYLKYSSNSETFSNVIKAVSFKVYVNSTLISKITCNVDLISDVTSGVPIEQSFSTQFIRSGSGSRTSTNFGYDIGSPLVVGSVKKQNLFIFHPYPDGFSLWTGDVDCGTLSKSSFDLILFGQNQIVQCRLKLALKAFDDCQSLYVRVRNLHLTSLPDSLSNSTKVTYVARGEDPSNHKQADFVPVIFDENWNDGPKKNVGPKLFYSCKVPSRFKVDVMYTSVVHSDEYKRINRIVGVKVKFGSERWHFGCDAFDDYCDNKTERLFTMKTNVDFYRVPVQWKYENTSRFWVDQLEEPCPGDTCFGHLLYYPLQQLQNLYGTDGEEFNLHLNRFIRLSILSFVLYLSLFYLISPLC